MFVNIFRRQQVYRNGIGQYETVAVIVWPGTSMWNEKIVSADPDFVHFCETIRFFLKFASNGLDNGLKLYYSFYSNRLFGR